ncbi:MAG: hypothetical protein HYT12_02465 [Candidatus Liptonbacteria bacterium]|nr:hypothetical protein [Candidatus Liptonbacteria bacterium]
MSAKLRKLAGIVELIEQYLIDIDLDPSRLRITYTSSPREPMSGIHTHLFSLWFTDSKDKPAADLPVAIFTSKTGTLRFLIPDNQGILRVINFNEKPEEFGDERFKELVRKVAKLSEEWGAGDPPGSKGSDFPL